MKKITKNREKNYSTFVVWRWLKLLKNPSESTFTSRSCRNGKQILNRSVLFEIVTLSDKSLKMQFNFVFMSNFTPTQLDVLSFKTFLSSHFRSYGIILAYI